MPGKKKVDRAQEAAADELLLRALRQLADETLEEEIPERLLRPLRAASGPPETAAPSGRPQQSESEDGAAPSRQETAQRRPSSRARSSRA